MPTNDAPAPPPRRRTLGRGPGAAPAAGPAAEPAPSPHPAEPEPEAPPASSAAPDPVPPRRVPGAGMGPEATAGDEAGDSAPAPGPAAPSDDPASASAAERAGSVGPGAPAARPAAPPEADHTGGTGPGTPPGESSGVPSAAPSGRPEPDPAHGRAEEGADGPVRPSAGAGGDRGRGAAEEAVSGASAASNAEAGPPAALTAAEGDAPADDGNRFILRLDNFEGPFDLLLQLISKHKLDVTEVALSKVTDDFMAHIRAMGPDWDLDQTTEFLVVAATLLDLKAARLLPAAEVEDEADLALLEARDLLFARLLQYRAYKRIADIFHDRLVSEAARHPRTVGLEPHHAELLPDVVISIGAEGFARLAVKAMQPKPKPQVYVDHIHAPLVSVREQAGVVVARLRELGEATFRTLTEDAPDVLTVVARFLALLELYRERAVLLDQPEALGALMVRWTGADGEQPLVTDEFDQEAGPPRKRAEEPEELEENEKQEVRS
ncbi:segregation and condensation protein A [Streptomyces sp. NEAU-Y11]|uniref:segregation and condensation protein A n=1 Tax=Streptomyces cucumeris TaxID=2962890 RepID=UPI0020C8A00C|nr:segregation/condensation protein A [Streptomyces sp. NEAU-Y11]MCP9208971.1 segregation/condensation protein A [Streptomyces sp. NEAU-Y11]